MGENMYAGSFSIIAGCRVGRCLICAIDDSVFVAGSRGGHLEGSALAATGTGDILKRGTHGEEASLADSHLLERFWLAGQPGGQRRVSDACGLETYL